MDADQTHQVYKCCPSLLLNSIVTAVPFTPERVHYSGEQWLIIVRSFSATQKKSFFRQIIGPIVNAGPAKCDGLLPKSTKLLGVVGACCCCDEGAAGGCWAMPLTLVAGLEVRRAVTAAMDKAPVVAEARRWPPAWSGTSRLAVDVPWCCCGCSIILWSWFL